MAEDKKIEDKKELADEELKDVSGGRLKINNHPSIRCQKCGRANYICDVCPICGNRRT